MKIIVFYVHKQPNKHMDDGSAIGPADYLNALQGFLVAIQEVGKGGGGGGEG